MYWWGIGILYSVIQNLSVSRKRYEISHDDRFADKDRVSSSASPIYVLAKVYEFTFIINIIIFIVS